MPRTVTPVHGAAASLLRLRIAAGLDLDDAPDLSPRLRRLVAVARQVGAPVADALDAGMAAEDDERQAQRAIAVASSQTRLVAGGLLVAPLLLVPGLGRVLGADPMSFYRSQVGLVVLAAGLALLALGGVLVLALLRRVGRPGAGRSARRVPAPLLAAAAGLLVWRLLDPAAAVVVAAVVWVVRLRTEQPEELPQVEEAVELIATAHGGGVTSAEALRLAAQQLPDLAADLNRLAFDLEVGAAATPGGAASAASASGASAVSGTSGLERLAAVLAAAHDVGAPIAPTLRRLAADLRADDLARVLAAAERLPAQLTFPTALCLLPGTILLVGAPIVQAGLAAAGT
jgi:Flp pilus assembly protein TadB